MLTDSLVLPTVYTIAAIPAVARVCPVADWCCRQCDLICPFAHLGTTLWTRWYVSPSRLIRKVTSQNTYWKKYNVWQDDENCGIEFPLSCGQFKIMISTVSNTCSFLRLVNATNFRSNHFKSARHFDKPSKVTLSESKIHINTHRYCTHISLR